MRIRTRGRALILVAAAALLAAPARADEGAAGNVAAVLPADTLVYARLNRPVRDLIEATLKAPVWRSPDEVRKLEGQLEGMMFEGLGEAGFKREDVDGFIGSVSRLHVALRGVNIETEVPELLVVAELSDPAPAAKLLAAVVEMTKKEGEGYEVSDYKGTAIHKFPADRNLSINIAIAGSWLVVALDPLTLKDALQARTEAPLVSLAQVPAFTQLADRYKGHDIFAFGNWQAGFALIRKAMGKRDQEMLDAADTVFGLRDFKAVGLGSKVETGAAGEVPTEATIVVAEGNPFYAVFKGAPLDLAQMRGIPTGYFIGLFAGIAEPPAKWKQVKEFITNAERAIAKDDDFPKGLEEAKKEYGIDIDSIAAFMAGPLGFFFGLDDRGGESGAVVLPVKDGAAAKKLLESMKLAERFQPQPANPDEPPDFQARIVNETIGGYEVLARVRKYGDEGFAIGPDAFIAGTYQGVKAAIAALTDAGKRDPGLAPAVTALAGGASPPKAMVLDPLVIARMEDEAEPLRDIIKPGVRLVVVDIEEAQALRLRANASVFTFAAAIGLTVARYEEQQAAGRECNERMMQLSQALEEYWNKNRKYPRVLEELAAAGSLQKGFECPLTGAPYEYFGAESIPDDESGMYGLLLLVCSKPQHGHHACFRRSTWVDRVSESRLARYRADTAAAAARKR